MSSIYAAKRLGRQIAVRAYLRLQRWLGRQSTQVPLPSGRRLHVRLRDNLARQILIDETFERETRLRMRNCVKAGMVVLDIGANFGYYTVQLADWVGPSGRVIAFEPNPVMIRELEQNVRLNNLQNTVVEPFALADQNGQVAFQCPPLGMEGHGSFRSNTTFIPTTTIKVPTRRLDDVLQELGLSAVDFIKMDVEGAERNVFQGATKMLSSAHKPSMIFECSERLCRPFGHCVLDVLREVADFGYYLEEIDHGMWSARPLGRS
jgi:FkbM family methyltransferase